MNLPTELPNDKALGLYRKYEVLRTDGDPTGKHADDEYFVLDLTTDRHAIPALAAYIESCKDEYPALAEDLRAKITEHITQSNQFVTVPETTLPNGLIVPSFQVGQYISAKGLAGMPVINAKADPWVRINFEESKFAADSAGYKLLTETQALAIAYDIVQQDINWTGGKVGEGKVFMGLHKDNVSEGQPGTYESGDPEERRWHQLSNGERIYDFSGNLYTWIFDDVQGDESDLTGKIAVDSPSLTTSPYPSMEQGMGWCPDAERDWSGLALIRGGCWFDGSLAGVFALSGGWSVSRDVYVGFRCTK